MEYIIIYGNPVDGLSFIGPFPNHDKALDYAGIHLNGEAWNVADLTSPEKDEQDEEDYQEGPHDWDDEDAIRRRMFADPGGNSALRAATKNNPRNLPCPTCHRPNLLTPEDRHLGYQCDRCADRAERGVDY